MPDNQNFNDTLIHGKFVNKNTSKKEVPKRIGMFTRNSNTDGAPSPSDVIKIIEKNTTKKGDENA